MPLFPLGTVAFLRSKNENFSRGLK